MNAAERELAIEQALTARNAANCPRREQLIQDLQEALDALHGEGYDAERCRELVELWSDLRVIDQEIDEVADKALRDSVRL